VNTRQIDRVIAAVNARRERFHFTTRDGVPDWTTVVCRDCSSRASVVTIPSDEVVEHDDWHAMIAEGQEESR